MRNNIINAFDKKKFLYKDSKSKTKEENQIKRKKSRETDEELKEYINNTLTSIEGKSKGINNDLLTKYFNFLKPIDWQINYMKQKMEKKNSEHVE